MIATATDSRPPASDGPPRHPALAVALGALLLLGACAEEPLPQRRLSADDCLTNVKLEDLRQALQRCDRVVANFPLDPQPLSERFLLHWLNDDEKAACRDIRRAEQLARRIPPAKLDRLLRRDLELRLASCREDPGAIPGRPAPSSAPKPDPPADRQPEAVR